MRRRPLRSKGARACRCKWPCRRRHRRLCAVEVVDLLLRRDAASRRDPAGGRVANREDGSRFVPPISPSVSTCVYRNSAQKGSSARTASTAVIGQRRLPSVDHDLAAPAVHGGDHRARRRPPRPGCLAKSRSGWPFLKSDEPAMTCRAPAARISTRARDGADAAADAAGKSGRRNLADDGQVVAVAHRGVEVDHLHLRKALEARTHPNTSSSLMASVSPWTSWTTAPS